MTAVFSIVAYLWLLLILSVISPGVVELWEAAVTFAFFPVLVLIAWLVEKKGTKASSVDDKQIELGNIQPGESKFILSFYFAADFPSVMSTATLQNNSPSQLKTNLKGD